MRKSNQKRESWVRSFLCRVFRCPEHGRRRRCGRWRRRGVDRWRGRRFAHLAACCEGKIAEIGFKKSCWHDVDGTTSWSESRLVKGENLVYSFGRLRGPVWATKDNGLLSGKGNREGCARVALAIVEGNGLDLVAKKRSEGRMVVNDYVDTFGAASRFIHGSSW